LEEELLQVETKHQINIHLRAINLTNPHLARTKSFADQRFNLSVVIDLAIIIETKAQLSSSNGQAAISNTFALPDTS